MSLKKVLTIAGSDTSGGAGIQADLKTFQELGVYGMTSLTTIVAQDPHQDWHHAVFPQERSVIEAQLETVLAGVGVDAAKTGMLGSIETIELVANKVDQYHIEKLVVDPVMVCKGADEALNPEVDQHLREVLVPKALVVTPNLFEASQIADMDAVQSVEEMKKAAVTIYEQGPSFVIIKGGGETGEDQSIDVLYDGKSFEYIESPKIHTEYTHGAGCTYSAAITAELAHGKPVREAIETAKQFITAAITDSFPLNQYIGPVNHTAYRYQSAKKER
ncbi:pyridoxine/pyridoxal/pyridoxamine kinase [Alteribacillus bidgolensis]|uniref:pyridoxal kinase n=1 Tax=Alteribacillus bidgolensis TaxID=930129 RepID=A0A1G8N0S5_9BACI|nr:pyridoxine/pyridoxal/pyridoxamine kinase [Alteribacillus bidgolensis]SDI73768.1 pyridoxine kinase [Alteribacillus bidgolensis]